MRSRDKSRRWGFTLIEVLVALAVVAIALVALLGLHLSSVHTQVRGEKMVRASLLAEEKIAEATLEGYPELGGSGGENEQDGMVFEWERQVRKMTVSLGAEQKIERLREIAVAVAWQEGRRRKQINRVTWVADRELDSGAQ